jgi:hypothetical protein
MRWEVRAGDAWAEGSTLGIGEHDPTASRATLRWDLDATAAALDVATLSDVLVITYDPSAPIGARAVSIQVEDAFPPRGWELGGPSLLGFTTTLDVLDEAPDTFAHVVVKHDPMTGGRADGWLFIDGVEPDYAVLDVVECWDVAGDRTWFGVQSDIPSSGTIAACAYKDRLIPM